MTGSTRGSGATVREALTNALGDLLDCEPGKVDLQIDAPGIDEVTGRLRLELDITPDITPDDASAPGDRDEVGDAAGEGDAGEGDMGFDREDDGQDDAAADTREDDREETASPLTAEDLDAEAEAAADFLEGLLDALDLPGDLRMRFHDDHVEIEVVDVGSGVLIGRRGQSLEAIQELLRCALQRQFQRRARVKVDVEGYRARRLEKLIEKTEEAIDAVVATGRSERLEPMDVFERKAVHHLVAQVEGLSSRSQGREPARRVIIERE